MRHHKEYNEIDKFIDSLFNEGDEIEWSCEKPAETTNGITVTVIDANHDEPSAEEEYVATLIEEITAKMKEIGEKMGGMPDDADRGEYMTKQRVVSRLIEVSNSIEGILLDMEPRLTANNLNSPCGAKAIIGGGYPAMF